MKILVLISCLTLVCIALPFGSRSLQGRKSSVPRAVEAIQHTVNMIHKRKRKRTQPDLENVDVDAEAFKLIDGNHNGHITAVEFANYYVENVPQLPLTYAQWIYSFRRTIRLRFPYDRNGQLELAEFRQL